MLITIRDPKSGCYENNRTGKITNPHSLRTSTPHVHFRNAIRCLMWYMNRLCSSIQHEAGGESHCLSVFETKRCFKSKFSINTGTHLESIAGPTLYFMTVHGRAVLSIIDLANIRTWAINFATTISWIAQVGLRELGMEQPSPSGTLWTGFFPVDSSAMVVD